MRMGIALELNVDSLCVIISCRLLMHAISSEMGLFEGHDQARVFTHNIELLRRDHYRLAGEMTSWSIANGGPGLPCLSSYMYDLWCGSRIASLEGAAEHVYDDTCQRLIKEVGVKAVLLTGVKLLIFSKYRCF